MNKHLLQLVGLLALSTIGVRSANAQVDLLQLKTHLETEQAELPQTEQQYQIRMKLFEVSEAVQQRIAEILKDSRNLTQNGIFNDPDEPAINLININISRIMERASEIGISKAFGATSRNLVGQFLLENLVLTAFGGLIGFLLAGLVLHLINRSGLIPYADFHLNLTVFICGLLLTLVFGAFAGVYPAWRMSRSHPVNALKGGAL